MPVRLWMEHLNGDSSLGLDPAVVSLHATLVNLILCHQHLEIGSQCQNHPGGAQNTTLVVPRAHQQSQSTHRSAEFPSQPNVQ